MKRGTMVFIGVLILAFTLVSLGEGWGPPKPPPVLKVGPGQTYAKIQDAVDAAKPRYTIIVYPGTYYENVIFRSDDHDIELKAIGRAIIANDGTLMFGISLQGGTHHISISGFEIRGFKQKDGAGIEGWTKYEDGDFAQISHIIIHHNYIYDNYDGINIGAWAPPWRHNDITILSNEIYNNHYRGINLWWVSESTVAHNEILNNGGDWNGNGVFVEPADDYNGNGVTDGDGVTLVNVNNLEVEHNKIHGSYEVGLSINQGKDSKFSHNDVRNNRNLGIALFGWGTPTTGNKFAYNDARGNCSQDILCYLNWGSMVYGNTWIKNIYDDVSPDPLV